MATQKDRVVVEIVVNSKGANSALKKINGDLTKIQKSAKSTSDHLRFFRDVTGLATFAIALNRLGSEMARIVVETTKLERGFKAVLGSQAAASKEMEWARETANRLGVEYLSSANALVSLTAAAKGTALEGQGVRDVFSAVSGAMSRLGRSTDDTKGALKAIEQMMNKGTVAAEELKGQLGERLPGALSIAADAMNVTTEELFRMMEQGELISEDFIPRFIDRLNQLYDDGQQVEGLVPAWNRLKNAISQTVTAADEATDASGAAESALDTLADALNDATTEGTALNEFFSETARMAGIAKDSFVDLASTMYDLAVAIVTLNAAKYSTAPVQKRKSTVTQALDSSMGGITQHSPIDRSKVYADNILASANAWNQLNAELDAASAITEQHEKDLGLDAFFARGKVSRKGGGGRSGGGGSNAAAREAERAAKQAAKDREDSLKFIRDLKGELDPLVEIQNDLEDTMNDLALAYGRNVIGLDEYAELSRKAAEQAGENVSELKEEVAEIDDLTKAMADSFGDVFEDLITGAATAEEALKSLFGTLAKELIKIGITSLANNAGGSFLGDVLKNIKFADGGVTSTGLPHGVYNRPTAFPINGGGRFANGVGILGEAGAEAIMPLTRRNGKLGVEGGGVNINVNNYAGVDVQTRQGINPGDIDIIVKRVADDVARGGSPVGRSIESTYGLARGKGRR